MTQTQTLLEAIDEVEQNLKELREQVDGNSLFSDSDGSDGDNDDYEFDRLADTVDDADELPVFSAIQMDEKVEVDHFADFYVDSDSQRDVWIVDPDDPDREPRLLEESDLRRIDNAAGVDR